MNNLNVHGEMKTYWCFSSSHCHGGKRLKEDSWEIHWFERRFVTEARPALGVVFITN